MHQADIDIDGDSSCSADLSELDGIATSRSSRVRWLFFDPKPSLAVVAVLNVAADFAALQQQNRRLVK